MLSPEKYAMADLNAVKSYERSEQHQIDLETLANHLMLNTPGLSREDAFVRAKEMLSPAQQNENPE